MRLEPPRHHVGVATLADLTTQPRQLVTKPDRPVVIEQWSERTEIGPQAPRGNPELMKLLRIVAEPHTRIAIDERS